jgi:hypothetical protein
MVSRSASAISALVRISIIQGHNIRTSDCANAAQRAIWLA